MPLKKNFCGSKSRHKTMFGREINYVKLDERKDIVLEMHKEIGHFGEQ
jgi:hypothetical protein